MGEEIPRTERPRRSGCARSLLATLATVAALLPAAAWLLMHVPGEEWWLSAVLVYAPKVQWVAVPIVGALLAAGARQWRLIVLNLGSATFALFVMAGYQLGAPAPIPQDRPIIRIASWNIYGWTKERDEIRDRILSWDCDVVCLQESGRPLFKRLLPGWDNIHVADLRVFVRGEILRHEAPPDPITGRPRMVLAEIETDARRFWVVNVHFPREERQQRTPREFEPFIDYVYRGVEIRDAKFKQLLDTLPADEPVIVAGDMNTPPASRYHRQVAQTLTDSFEAVGEGFGHTFVWRRQFPLLRIDYVWTGGGIDPVRHRLEPHRTSDHRPVVVEVALPDGDRRS